MKALGRLAALSLIAFSCAATCASAQPVVEAPSEFEEPAAPDDYDAWEGDEPEPPVTDLDAVDAAHAAYLRQSGLQLQRPESDLALPEPAPAPGWLQAIGRFLDWLSPFFRWVFYAAAAAVVCGVLYFLLGEAIRMRFRLRKDSKKIARDDDLLDLRPDAGRARSLLDEADALAREGRFAEAVHLLLFRSIEDIQHKTGGGVPTSLTAREIAGFERLPARARTALQPIIRIVEQSFFGGRPVDQQGWASARTSYEDFAFGAAWT